MSVICFFNFKDVPYNLSGLSIRLSLDSTFSHLIPSRLDFFERDHKSLIS